MFYVNVKLANIIIITVIALKIIQYKLDEILIPTINCQYTSSQEEDIQCLSRLYMYMFTLLIK